MSFWPEPCMRFLWSVALSAALLLTLSSAARPTETTAEWVNEYMEVWEQGRAAYGAGDWPEAANLYRQVAESNPNHGAVWRTLGYAYLRSGNFDSAVEAYDKARSCGVSPAICFYDVACAHALAGRADTALRALEQAFAHRFANDALIRDDHDLSSLHGDPRFRRIVGWPEAEVSERNERWNRDLDFLDRRLRDLHWRPFQHLPEASYKELLRQVRESIPNNSDLQLRADLQRLLARIGDGHTAVVSDAFRVHHGGVGQVHILPMRFDLMDDDVVVEATTGEHRDLAGARVTSIGGAAIGRVLDELDELVSRDNEWGAKWFIANALADPWLLASLGLGTLEDGTTWSFSLRTGETVDRIVVPGGREVFGAIQPAEKWWNAADTPFLRSKHQHLYIESLEAGLLYVRIDRIGDAHGESFHEFADRIFDTAETADSQALILDFRDNPGGQGHLTPPLLRHLIRSQRFRDSGTLYVLIGRKTFSAAMALCAQIEQHTSAIFVGEPTGSRPNFVGESSIIQLPYSEIPISISSRYHQNGASNDYRLWIPPAIPAVNSMEDRSEGRDVAIEAVRADFRRRRGH